MCPVSPGQLALLLTCWNFWPVGTSDLSRSDRHWISRYIRARFSAGIDQLHLPEVVISYSNLLKKRIWPLAVFGFSAKAFNKAPTVLAARMYWVVLKVSSSRQELSRITFFSARIKCSTSFKLKTIPTVPLKQRTTHTANTSKKWERKFKKKNTKIKSPTKQ